MAKKQFKIGECAVGGIIAVEITGKRIDIKALDYNSKKVVNSSAFLTDYSNCERYIDNYLNDLTTSYYAGKVLDWIKSKVALSN
jgi:hypothetical protein